MSRDVYVLHHEPGKGWIPTAVDEAARGAVVAELASITDELKNVTEDEDGRRGKLLMRRRHLHSSVPQECMVESGRANIKTVEEGDRNAKVTLRPDHLNDPIHGHLDMSDPTLWANLQAVRAAGGRCRYRIVVRRQPDVDPRLPWDKVPDKKRVRDLVGVEVLAADGSTAAPAPAPAPVPEPAATRHLQPVADRLPRAEGEWWPQNPNGEPTCPLCGKSTFGSAVLKHQPTGRFAHKEPCMKAWLEQADPVSPPPPPADVPRQGNLSSGIDGSMATVEIAHADLVRRLGHNPSVGQVKGLAHCLQDAVAQILRDVGTGGEERAREAVRIALAGMPPPASPAERAAWVDALAAYGAQLLRAAVELAVAT